MQPGRVAALIIGSLMALLGAIALLSGVLLASAYLTQRDDGFIDVTLDDLESSEVAVTAERIDLRVEPGTPRWLLDALDTDVRIRATPLASGQAVFIGVAPERDLDQYLAGVGHDEIRDVDNLRARFSNRTGATIVEPPGDQDFWATSAEGSGTQELVWEPTDGRWAIALMNADGSPGVGASVNVGIRSAAFVPALWALFIVGGLLAVAAAVLIVIGGRGLSASAPPAPVGPAAVAAPVSRYPLTLEGHLDPGLSRWRWLVKWLLAIPHLIILFFLWIAFVVLTVVAGFAILFTGRYPRSIFDFNVGVLRWTWRVSFYALSGGLGTDRYPPFSLGSETDYPATLDVEYPEHLSRGLVLIKWWLLAIPHYLIIAFLTGPGLGWQTDGAGRGGWNPGDGGLIGLLSVVAAVILLFTARYPEPLFKLIVGLNRWVFRVTAYAALMTDRYPPFRLDQGGAEPVPDEPAGPDPFPEPARTPSEGTDSIGPEPTIRT